MVANPLFRKVHRKIAPLIFIPLLLTAFTGILYRLGRSWMGLSNNKAEILMAIHQGEFLGEPLVPIYILLVGLGLIAMIASGLTMIRLAQIKRNNSALNLRKTHQILAPILTLPLFLSASTGILYRLGNSWFHIPRNFSELLLRIHQGSYLGSVGKTVYVALIGLGLIVMLITGIQLTGIFRKKRVKVSDKS